MDSFISMILIQTELLIYMLVGIYARKIQIIDERGRQCLIDVLLKIALPCMVFASFNQHISAAQMISASMILLVSLAVCYGSSLLGKIFWRNMGKDKQSVLRYGTLISNAGFAGLPLVEKAFGSLGLFYASIYLIPIRIFMWTSGMSLFMGNGKKEIVKSVWLNPGIVAVFLGLVRMIWDIPLPGIMDSSIKAIGSSTTFLSMLIVGSILADVPMRGIWDKKVFEYTGVRLILIPGLILVVLKLIHFDSVATAAAVTLSGMPAGATTSLLAEKYGADHIFASKCVFLSTVLSVIIVPIFSIFF